MSYIGHTIVRAEMDEKFILPDGPIRVGFYSVSVNQLEDAKFFKALFEQSGWTKSVRYYKDKETEVTEQELTKETI